MPGFIELKDVRKIYRMGEVEIKADASLKKKD